MLITGAEQKQAWLDRRTPPVEQVRDTVWSIPVDFHGSPIRYTFAYVITDAAGGAVIIDPGWDSDFGRAQLADGLARMEVALEDVVGIVATHFHPDHLGMVARIAAETGAWVAMHPEEARLMDLYRDAEWALDADGAWLREIGVPPAVQRDISVDTRTIHEVDALARPTLLVEDGDLLPFDGERLRIVSTPGHTPGHIAVADERERVFFSGDHILPRITPNVGLTSTGRRPGALADYYSSLRRMTEWDDFEVLPAHEYRFTGLAERADQLATHHDERSNEIEGVVGSGATSVFDVASRLTWGRGWAQLDGVNLRAALGEVAAHVEHLETAGRIRSELDEAGVARLFLAPIQ